MSDHVRPSSDFPQYEVGGRDMDMDLIRRAKLPAPPVQAAIRDVAQRFRGQSGWGYARMAAYLRQQRVADVSTEQVARVLLRL